MRPVDSIENEADQAGVREIYDEIVSRGNSPQMALMLAMKQPPTCWNTDTDFQRRENARMRSIEDDRMEIIQGAAKRAGIDTSGKTYNGQLGTYSDPHAWVSDTHDVRKAAEAKGLEIDGMVKANYYRGPSKKTRLAPDILDRLEKQARSKDKLLDEKCSKSDNTRKELRQKLTEKHSKPKD